MMKKNYTKAMVHFLPLTGDVDAANLAALTDEQLADVLHRSEETEERVMYLANPDLIEREIGDEWMLVPTGRFSQNFNGIIQLNIFSHFVWQQFEEPNTLGAVLDAAHKHFNDPHHMLDIQVRELVTRYAKMGMFGVVKN